MTTQIDRINKVAKMVGKRGQEREEMPSSPDLISELKSYLRAALDYIDAIPKEAADQFPGMPGFDREYVENLLEAPYHGNDN